MKTKALLFLAAIFASATAYAGPGPQQACSNYGVALDDAQMDSNQSFDIGGSASTGYGLATVHLDLTDANTSITSFQMQCFGKYASEADEYKLQSCTTSSGACTSDDATWTKASPGSSKWLWRVDIEGLQSFKCTMSVAGGTGASADTITAKVRLCTKG